MDASNFGNFGDVIAALLSGFHNLVHRLIVKPWPSYFLLFCSLVFSFTSSAYVFFRTVVLNRLSLLLSESSELLPDFFSLLDFLIQLSINVLNHFRI